MNRVIGPKFRFALLVAIGVAAVSVNSAAAASGPNLAITGSSNPGVVSPVGGRVAYVLTISNTGTTTVKTSTIADAAPAGATYEPSLSDGCWTPGPGGLVCTLGSLAPGASVGRRIVFTTPTAPGTITNVATIFAKSDTSPADNTASTSTGVAAANPTNAAGLLTGSESLALDTAGGLHQVTLPAAAAMVTSLKVSGPAALCGAPCQSETVTVDFPLQLQAALDPVHPVRLDLLFENLPVCGGLANCHDLYYADALSPAGQKAPFCPGALAGNQGFGYLGPGQKVCVNDQSRSPQAVQYTVLLKSVDPNFGIA